MNVWLITGAGRGLGREIARQAQERGDSVVATARRPEQVTEALRAEVEPLGIQVVIIEPGSFRTDFLDGSSLQTASQVIDELSQWRGLAVSTSYDDPA
jgi:NAD(P)-dependent dehydrogenase (short-subunit alcohol dehydrogenase family)